MALLVTEIGPATLENCSFQRAPLLLKGIADEKSSNTFMHIHHNHCYNNNKRNENKTKQTKSTAEQSKAKQTNTQTNKEEHK